MYKKLEMASNKIMEISDIKPEEIIESAYTQEYNELYNDIWGRLIHVHTNIIILECIEEFAFERFYGPQENIFWKMIYWNFLYVAIVFLHGLTNDQGGEKHTLARFKNRLLEWIKPTLREAYREKLKSVKFSEEIKRIGDKVTEMRHKVIVHRILSQEKGLAVEDVEGVTVSEIRRYYDATEELFHACSFGSEHSTTFIPYYEETCNGKPVEKDIDKLLNLIVKDSYWLNEPELKKEFWSILRETKSEEEIRELNEYRKRFRMPEL